MTNQQLASEDLKYIWHPCTQMKDHEKDLPLIPIKEAKGVYIYDFDGNRYLDSISSWWVNLFGHSNDYINEKLSNQAKKLEHVIFAGFTHEEAIRLSKRLCNKTKMDKIFFADNGSSAIEVALKMSFHFHKNRGKIKKYFVSLENSYHGETLGALAVGDVKLYKEVYSDIVIKTLTTVSPKDQSEAEALKAIESLGKLLSENHENISALILEPLLQCAGGMRMYHPIYITEAKSLCLKYDIHLILDEIATGFGRCGTFLAHEPSNIKPDFITLSKGLTAGYMPLAVTLTTDEIYNEFYCNFKNYEKTFFHSHSYTGNALACSVANATLDIFENENVIENNREKIDYMREKSKIFENLDVVKDIRQCGFVLAIELIESDIEKRVNLQIYKFALSRGIYLRPLGDVIYFMPPYIITKDEIDLLFNVTLEAILQLK